ncbi:MAG: DUF3048 domain-containing protein [Patescibacteria group bacterium]
MQTHRKAVLVIAPIILVLLFAGVVGLVRYFSNSNETVPPNVINNEEVLPVLVPHLLNGVLVEPAIAKRHPVAAMIENSTAARPQVGLTSADVVYEAVSEGGITRFMAVYSQVLPEKAGPVRSARSYFIDWLSEFDAFYVHAGGSPTALQRIGAYGIKDYPHSNDGTYAREPMPGVASEHTLFANIAKVFEFGVSKKGWSAETDFTSWKFKDAEASLPLGGTVDINFSSASFAVKWTIDKTTNTYIREMAGAAHKDRLSGEQITAKTVIAMTVQRSANAAYSTGKESEWNMTTIGSGNASIFIDGKQIRGTWNKPSRTERTKFLDEAGNEITLNRGKIWVEVVPQTGSFGFTPETPPAPATTP